jgi:hypothetical protein
VGKDERGRMERETSFLAEWRERLRGQKAQESKGSTSN